ncbi:MAG: transposase [Ferruginibacter sp.]
MNAFVIMSNHIHLIARTQQHFLLSDFIRDFKRHTHKTMIPVIQSELESRRLWMLHQFQYYGSRHTPDQDFQIWTNNSHPEELVSAEMTLSKLNYIHQNPVRAGIVEVPEHYLYSSAANYCRQKGILKIDLL